ncbi:MAG: hypothetical protein ABI905_14380 [Betaproteobacteria bacterium]
MKSKILRGLLGIGIVISSNAFATNGTITGITLSKSSIQSGETINFTVQGNVAPGKKCHIYGLRGDTGESYDLGVVSSFPAQFPGKPLTISKTGTQYIHASGGTADKENECTGSVKAIVTVLAKTEISAAPAAGMVPVAKCPAGYRTDMTNPSTGELKCTKLQMACPANFTSSLDQSTGILTCTPKAEGDCPAGWSGGFTPTGQLVCYPRREVVACVDSAPEWKWGDKYYVDGWSVVGCYKKPKVTN